MSGDFVQRGAPAILDQHDRAELALLGGADLILQLPCHFALGSAQHFARGAVSLLTALGCVDFLCFGSEYGDTAPFLELADVLLHEPEEYREAALRSASERTFLPDGARTGTFRLFF